MAVYVGTVGLQIQLELGITLDALASVGIRYLKPDGTTTGTWAAAIDDASGGLISYTTTSVSDLDAPGPWKLNGVYDPSGVNVFYGETCCLEVKDLGT